MTMWKILAWVILIFWIIGTATEFIYEPVTVATYIGVGAGIIGFIPIFGYAYQQPFAVLGFWRFVCILQILIFMAFVYFLLDVYIDEKVSTKEFIYTLFGYVLGFIQLMASFLYAFRSPHLWDEAPQVD